MRVLIATYLLTCKLIAHKLSDFGERFVMKLNCHCILKTYVETSIGKKCFSKGQHIKIYFFLKIGLGFFFFPF